MPECRAFKRVPDRAPAFGVRQLAGAFARGTGESATVWLALVDGQRRRVAALQTLPRLTTCLLVARSVWTAPGLPALFHRRDYFDDYPHLQKREQAPRTPNAAAPATPESLPPHGKHFRLVSRRVAGKFTPCRSSSSRARRPLKATTGWRRTPRWRLTRSFHGRKNPGWTATSSLRAII